MIGTTNVKVKPNKQVDYVEYIESTGTQYIDTGVVGNQNISIKAKFKTGNYSGGTAVFGKYVDSVQSISLTINNNGSGANSRFGNSVKTLNDWDIDVLYEVALDKKNLIINKNTYALGSTNTFSTTNNLLIFHNGDANTNKFIGYIYYLQIYENDILVRDFRPAKDGAGVYCLYDEVEKRYYYNQGTGNFIGDGWEPTQLAYIESTGTQYIDTNYIANENTKYEIALSASTDNVGMNIMGSRNSANSNNIALLASSSNFYIDFNNSSYSTYRLGYIYSINTKYKLSVSKSLRAIYDKNNTLLASEQTECPDTIVGASNTYIGNISGTAPWTSCFIGKIYSCKIYDNDILVRDFVPAIEHNDVICLYDKVTKTCFYNAGTGEFGGGI